MYLVYLTPDDFGIMMFAEAFAAVVLTSTHDPADYGDGAARCGARGFVPKAELSGQALSELLS